MTAELTIRTARWIGLLLAVPLMLTILTGLAPDARGLQPSDGDPAPVTVEPSMAERIRRQEAATLPRGGAGTTPRHSTAMQRILRQEAAAVPARDVAQPDRSSAPPRRESPRGWTILGVVLSSAVVALLAIRAASRRRVAHV